MKRLYELKSTLCDELCQYGEYDHIDMTSLHVIDTLAHAIKNIDRIIEVYEEKGSSFARGRRMARRDAMGRYSRDDARTMVDELRDMLPDLSEEKQAEVKNFIKNLM